MSEGPEDQQPVKPTKPTLILAPHPGPLTSEERQQLVDAVRALAGLPPLTNQAAEREIDGQDA